MTSFMSRTNTVSCVRSSRLARSRSMASLRWISSNDFRTVDISRVITNAVVKKEAKATKSTVSAPKETTGATKKYCRQKTAAQETTAAGTKGAQSDIRTMTTR